MDKYQELLIDDKSKFYILAEDQNDKFYNAFINNQISLRKFNEKLTDCNSKTFRKEIKIADFIEIKQLEDIKIKKYFLFFYNKNFENIHFSYDGKSMEALKKSGEDLTVFGIQLNFDKKIENIEIEFKLNLADPLTINVEFIPADEKAYYRKEKEKEKQTLIEKMKVSHSCGNDLVTIKFSNCNKDVKNTKITLLDANKQLMGTFNVDEGMFYKSIINLAYGTYFYKISQFDKKDKLIVESDFIEFKLQAPNYSGRGMVRPHP